MNAAAVCGACYKSQKVHVDKYIVRSRRTWRAAEYMVSSAHSPAT